MSFESATIGRARAASADFVMARDSADNGGMAASVCLNLDDAWDAGRLAMRVRDCREWGARLRYTAPDGVYREAFRELRSVLGDADFVLYGSGDFHHLAAGFLRGCLERHPEAGAVTLVSFDNHPDWDVRPPKWGCGGWVNRALEMAGVERAAVWGCGNFELAFPARVFRNRRALKAGRLEVHGWAERQSAGTARRFDCMTMGDWRGRFLRFAEGLRGKRVYVTVDMDCLGAVHAVTNWEQGLFTPADVAWAVGEVRRHAKVIGGDLCGAYSPEAYARRGQRWVARFDHPKLPSILLGEARRRNHEALEVIWPALSGFAV